MRHDGTPNDGMPHDGMPHDGMPNGTEWHAILIDVKWELWFN